MAVPEGIVVAIEALADIPAGWTPVVGLYGRYPKISAMDRDFEATKNLIASQPKAATGVGTWTTAGTNNLDAVSLPTEGIPSLRLPTGQFITTAFRITYQDNLTLLQSAALTIVDVLHTVSAYIYVDPAWAGDANLTVRAAASFGSSVEIESVEHDPAESGVWRPIKQVFDPSSGDLTGNVQLSVLAGGVAPSAGDIVYITAIQVEAKDHRTTYCDGDQPGCVWDGADEASTSTRASTESARTGGAATHTHTAPSHLHSLNNHSHINNPPLPPDDSIATGGADYGYNQPAAGTGHTHVVGPTVSDGASPTGSTTPTWASHSNEPEFATIVFIRSDGTPVGIPANAITWWQLQEIPDSFESVFLSRYFKGAAVAVNGGVLGGNATHSHAGVNHSHATGSHIHLFAEASQGGIGDDSGPASFSSGGSVPNTTNTANIAHKHELDVLASVSTLAAAASGNNGIIPSDPHHVSLWALKNLGGETEILDQTIMLWDRSLSEIPIGWVPCNGAFFTPDMRNKFVKNSPDVSSVGSVGGSHTHAHADPAPHVHSGSHVHPIDSHGPNFNTQDAGPYANHTSTDDHDHDNVNSSSGGGITQGTVQKNNSSNNEPPYYQMHMIRLGVGTPGLSDPYSRVAGIIT